MNHLEISLLGGFQVTLNGSPVTQFQADTARALLAYLALHANAPCRRETLAGLLWPDQSETVARHNLRTALSRVRRAINVRIHTSVDAGGADADADAERAFLLTTRKTIQLNPESEHWLDVAAFDDLIATCQAHAHPRLEACPACAQRLQEAVDLYRGDLLAGFSLPSAPFEEWVVVERERRHRQVIEALYHLAAYHTEAGTYDQAARYARRQLELEPWREVAHRQLMRALALGGQRGAALRQYEACVRVLEAELGVSPQEETASLYRAIQEGRERAAAGPQPERYRLERKLSSKGAFSDVWVATDTVLEREVVLKCPKGARDRALRERFLAEARMLAGLNHPNIIQIYDGLYDEKRDCFLLVIEYLEGMDLDEMFAEGYSLSLEHIREIATKVLQALSYLHEQGVVHRDVKPANVRITYVEPGVKLFDFNLASLQAGLQQGTHYRVGTVPYMPPEQIAGRPTDGRADLYSLGVVLYEMIAGGRLPFDCADEDEMLDAHLHAAPLPLTQYAPTVPPALEQVVMRLLAKDPEDRYPSAEAVIEALDAIQIGPGVSNLPVFLTPFVGREREMAAVAERLSDPDCRLLTLVGPGGIGKTRLAVEAALAQIDVFAHGVFFVPLAPLQSVDAIVPTVAQALGLSFYEGDEPRQQLLDYLRQKSMLIVMDNFEHLLSLPRFAVPPTGGDVQGADLVVDILKTAPDVRVVATSRERLNVGGEHLFPVAGMDVPEEGVLRPDEPTASSAVRLFLHSARRVRPSFEPTEEDLAQVGRICRLVEGMPLGILLAASLMEMLTPVEIAVEVAQGIDVLETDLRDTPARQRSIRALLDHSWDLLTERQQKILQALSVFRGGFTRQAAQAVAGATLRDLMALTHKSLLRRTSGGRYNLWHELLRQYADEKLDESPTAKEKAQDLHCEYYAEFLHQREAAIMAGEQKDALLEMDNIRASWRWGVIRGKFTAIRKSASSVFLYQIQGWYPEAKATFGWAADALRMEEPVGEGGIVFGQVLGYLGWFSRQTQLLQESLSILRKLGARWELAWVSTLAFPLGIPRNPSEARQLFQEGLALAEEKGLSWGMASMHQQFGFYCRNRGAYKEAEHHFREALRYASVDIERGLKNHRNMAIALESLGHLAYLQGSYPHARQFYKKSYAHHKAIGYQSQIGIVLESLGDVELAMGEYKEAKERYHEALAMYKHMGIRWQGGVAITLVGLGDVALAVGNHQKAKAKYCAALEIGLDTQREGVCLFALIGLSFWLAQAGQTERAVELATLSLFHLHAHRRAGKARAYAQKLLDELGAELPLDVFSAAQERGRARDLWATAEELLAELAEQRRSDTL